MKPKNKTILNDVKGQLIRIVDCNCYEVYDIEQLEYLIQLIDYILLDKMPLCKRTIIAFMQEIITTSIYGMNPALLSVLHDVNELEEEIDDNEIPIHEEL